MRDLAFLFYFEKQRQFYIEIPKETDPWDLPFILFDFAQKGQYTIDAVWSMGWVRQRIVPTDRQNLGQILRENGLSEYDEYKLLMLSHGRCEQDGCYLTAIGVENLPEEIRDRLSRKVETFFPLQDGELLVFFQDGQTRLCDIGQISKGDPAFRRLLAYYNEFRRAYVLAGGYGIGWDENRSICDQDLYQKGTDIPVSWGDLREGLAGSLVNTREAARLLNCSRQFINTLVKKGKLRPLRQFEKDTLFLRSDLDAMRENAAVRE